MFYGFSMEELSRRIIADATDMFLDLPEESLGEYENALEIKKAFRKAVEADKKGSLRASLPRSITRQTKWKSSTLMSL